MYNMKLSEEEAFLIFSLRKGYARCPDVIYTLAGFPWTEKQVDEYINNVGEYEQNCKKLSLDGYYDRCRRLNKAPNIREINRIARKWDAQIEEKRQQSIEQNDLQNARYDEFLKSLKVVSL